MIILWEPSHWVAIGLVQTFFDDGESVSENVEKIAPKTILDFFPVLHS